MFAIHGVHVQKEGDTVGVKSNKNDNSKLKEAISKAPFCDEIDVGEAGTGRVNFSERVVTRGMKGGGYEGGG